MNKKEYIKLDLAKFKKFTDKALSIIEVYLVNTQCGFIRLHQDNVLELDECHDFIETEGQQYPVLLCKAANSIKFELLPLL